ncbi:MAG TPA: MoxR family ATPase [Phycisphaerae bacterium]|jgi:MoxR-like ATPase|nr:MoxR family ATPase [Phycisphaerae bacterium]HOB75069.1 MoxR family ATPase [Phycisphaerae bacterium]HOJ53214.1 MoxR family ATPase [Phycisphaerae bacterium]HOL25178.1 MoxR family ATPase [Phycisphaerae bacterium]HPP20268.1 MoxR family ATPase [Phycisphaerae bacterium]
MATDVKKIGELVAASSAPIRALIDEVGKVIIGQKYMVERLVIGLLANGHVLLEGVPGLAKSLTVTTLAKAVRAKSRRIQFTPDLLPADLIGTQIYNQRTGEFTVRKGPIFANIILADEVNRAPAKVQSALLEAMQERQVSIGEETYRLEEPFLVLATQNPLEQEGTYPLPEAQVDRFLLKLKIDYPTKEEERRIVDRRSFTQPDGQVNAVVGPEDILKVREIVDEIYVDDKIRDYIIDIVFATREPEKHGLKELANLIEYGASPRASIALTLAAKAHAFLQGRGYVTPQDVKSIGMDVLRHRVILTYEAEAEEKGPEDVLQQVFDSIRVP